MINLFINYINLIDNFNYIYSIFYYLNIKVKLYKNKEDIINFIDDNFNEEDEYIFFEFFNIELFIKIKLNYNKNIFYFINNNYDIKILNNRYNKVKYILVSNNYYKILNYKNEKIILNYQFDVNRIYNIEKISNIYNYNENINNFLENNKLKYNNDKDYDTISNNIIIFDDFNLNDEYIIIKLILNGNIIFIKNNDHINYLFFYNLLLAYENNEQLITNINKIKKSFHNYSINYNNYIKYFKQKLLLNNKKFYQKIEELNDKDDDFGFIMLRHVNNKLTNELWLKNLQSIRTFYRNIIFIIDDNSNKEILTNNQEYTDVKIIQSKHEGRGEILPYYYLYCNQLFKRCLIIHDSVFINKFIDFSKYKKDIHYLWHFDHNCNNLHGENEMMNILNNDLIIQKYDEKKWHGCFGVQTIINYDFIEKIQKEYNIFSLMKYIDNRSKRMNFERIFSVLCTLMKNELYEEKSIYGDIHEYIEWGYTYNNYIKDIENSDLEKFDLIKTWNGR